MKDKIKELAVLLAMLAGKPYPQKTLVGFKDTTDIDCTRARSYLLYPTEAHRVANIKERRN